jgi:hypothetical protein
LSRWVLSKLESQLVAGRRYCFTFEDPKSTITEQYCVWSQPWNNNFLEITLPDGSRINNNSSTSGGIQTVTTTANNSDK